MIPIDRYVQLYLRTNPNDPLVADEIKKGMRWAYGETDMHHHLPRLRELAKGNVLEIGVRFGASTAALLAGVEEKGGHVWSVDMEPCEFARSLFEGNPQWSFIRSDSRYVDEQLLPQQVDLLFIDGDHSYEGVRADLGDFGPRSKVIVCHDFHRWNNGQVVRAIGHYLRAQRKHTKLRVYRESSGLAVIS